MSGNRPGGHMFKPQHRRATRWGVMTLSLGVVGLLGIDLLYQPGRFPFRQIDIAVQTQPGALAVDRDELGRTLAEVIGGNYFSTDLSHLAVRAQQVPGVYRASLRRRWPDTLQVLVQPVRPQAVWNQRQCLHIDGQPVECPESAHTGLARLYGAADMLPKIWQRFAEWRGLLAQHQLMLQALQLDEQGLWRLLAAGSEKRPARIQILLPDVQADVLLSRFARAASGHLAAEVGRMQQVDLRYTSGFAVQWRAEPFLSAQKP